jgi:hypothetical protein
MRKPLFVNANLMYVCKSVCCFCQTEIDVKQGKEKKYGYFFDRWPIFFLLIEKLSELVLIL